MPFVRECDVKDCQLQEFPVSEKEALKQLNVVTISRREVELVSELGLLSVAMLLNILLNYVEARRDRVWGEETHQSIKEQASWETGNKSL